MYFFLSFVPRNYPPFICLCIWSIVLQCKYFDLSITLSLCATGLLWPIFAKPLTKKVKVGRENRHTDWKTDRQKHRHRQAEKNTDTDRLTKTQTNREKGNYFGIKDRQERREKERKADKQEEFQKKHKDTNIKRNRGHTERERKREK